ncbi:hypothetical protein F5883DRAFT_268787 [Diaporthe sp. PMI_573]|nr:hypothetical protein F5883DRAFT_268787 [Diaporthaceae sp. PMI_573]
MMANDSASSPTASACSGTPTNPNTPRSEHDAEQAPEKGQTSPSGPQPGQDESVSASSRGVSASKSSTSSAGSHQRRHDIQPIWPRKVETKTPALVLWQSHRLESMFLDMNWTPHDTSGSAFFKLRMGLRFEGGPSARRDGQVNVFVFIHPERVSQLSFNAEPNEKPFGTNTVALTFNMNRAPALVLPSTYDHVAQGGEQAMKSLRELATQLSFTVYTSLPRKMLPLSSLRQLCTAVTDHRLSSILACASLLRLYRGQGAQLLEGDDLSEPVPDPPAYDDVGPCPPHLSESQKRRRRSSSKSASGPVSCLISQRSVEALLDDRLDKHRREVLELFATHKSQVLQMLSDFKTELDNKLDAREERLVVDRLSDLVAEKVEEGMEEVQETRDGQYHFDAIAGFFDIP